MSLDRRGFLKVLTATGLLAAGGPAVAALVRADEVPPRAPSSGSLPPTTGPAAAALGAPGVGVAWPPIVPRSAWDPDGTCVPRRPPELGPPVTGVVVHHTQIFAEHSRAEAPGMVRNLCESHVRQRGFDDLGYHLIIDRFGTIYEGRAGGLSRPIVGAHAQGMNHGTIGVALLGDFDRDPVSEDARGSLVRVIAFLSQLHAFDPAAVVPHVSTGGASSRFAEGDVVDLPGIASHHRVGATSCPGENLHRYVVSGELLRDVVATLS